MTMEERMTVCNMSIEGGARCGYVNPDADDGRLPARPRSSRRRRGASSAAVAWWRAMASDADAAYDDVVRLDGATHRADGHLGHQSRPGDRRRRDASRPPSAFAADEREVAEDAYAYMELQAGHADRAARRSTWRSSARAPTAASPTCARRREVAQARQGASRTSRRWSCRARRRSRAQAEAEGLRRGLPRTPASSGACRAARCAWR